MSRKRPPTSKARGICKYYSTERGCFAGAKCRFLHGEQEELTPYDRSKTCRFYAAGYCRRGDDCWFLHVSGDDTPASGSRSSKRDAHDAPEASADEEENLCSICMEKPVTFGLLGTFQPTLVGICVVYLCSPHSGLQSRLLLGGTSHSIGVNPL